MEHAALNPTPSFFRPPSRPRSPDTVEADRPTTSSLLAPEVARTLDRLHRRARTDLLRIALVAPVVVPDFFGFRKVDDERLSRRMRSVYVPVSRSQGRMLYLVARSIDAHRIVEFGTSFGISTLYLAAAVKDNGGGVVVGSENEPSKHAKANENLREAGLDAFADVRLGDAMQTLAGVEAPVDMVLLDGWKDMYLPMLELLQPKLRPRAVVLADNIFTFRKALRPYVAYVQSAASGFVSATLDISDGFEMSVFTGRRAASSPTPPPPLPRTEPRGIDKSLHADADGQWHASSFSQAPSRVALLCCGAGRRRSMTHPPLRIPLVLTWTAAVAAVACAGVAACSGPSSKQGTALDSSVEDVEASPDAAPVVERDARMATPDVATPAECEGMTDSGIVFFQADASECPDGDPTLVV